MKIARGKSEERTALAVFRQCRTFTAKKAEMMGLGGLSLDSEPSGFGLVGVTRMG